MIEKYEMVIGLEVHVQLNTKTKAFCGDENKFGADPNTLVSAISLGHPGTLPRLNKMQLEKAVRLGLAIGGNINTTSTFDRKNYFYPDLPKGYQITQDKTPIVVGGSVDVGTRNIRIHHIHMEEDAGKLIHDLDDKYSMVDLNRAGVPLLEIVTEPDFRSAAEVEIFLEKLRQLVRWLDVSDGNMEQGSLRCDVNLSLRFLGQTIYGNRCEIKNLNSMRFARQAIKYERARQQKILEHGGTVQQQTLNFDPAIGRTSALRSKEEAHDYRYFPDPDLPPVVITPKTVDAIKKGLPELPWAIIERWQQDYKLSRQDAAVLTQSKERADLVDAYLAKAGDPKMTAQFLVNKIIPFVNEQKISLSQTNLTIEGINNFLNLILSDKVSASMAYQKLFPEWIKDPNQDSLLLAQRLNLIQNTDTDDLEQRIAQIISANPKEVAAYKKGKKQLLGFFMGELMKSKGSKANPKVAKEMIEKMLS